MHTCPPEEEGDHLYFRCVVWLLLLVGFAVIVCFFGSDLLYVSQRSHGAVDMAESVVKPAGYRQFSCQSVDSTGRTALNRNWLISLPSSFLHY